MTRPRHMAVSSWGRPGNPHSTGCLSTVAVLVLWLVLFAGVMTAMSCQPVDGECGGETDCSEVRP